MTHFTDVELQRWRDNGPEGDRDRVVRHVAECAACARRYAAAIRTHDAVEPDPDVADFVAAGRRLGSRAAPVWRRPWALSLGAAAAVAIAIVAPRFASHEEGSPASVLRGGAVQALTPSGETSAADLRFGWSSGVSTGRFRIDIGDANGPIASSEAASSPWVPPAEIRARLRGGVTYWWQVAALDDRGSIVTSSARRTFAIARP